MKRAGLMLAAFLLLVAGIESLHVAVDWWHAGRPQPGWREWLAFATLAAVGVTWWRHSVFSCRNACLAPPPDKKDA